MKENLINITFESLFEILRMEKKRDELQELPKTFFEDVKSYIKEKLKIRDMGKNNLFSPEEMEKTEKQIQNIQKILDELYNRREIKIINLAIMKSKSEMVPIAESNFLEQEKALFEQLAKTLKSHKIQTMEKYEVKLIPESQHDAEEKTPRAVKVEFTSKVPKFMGRNMEIFGPYEKSQICDLPCEIADILIKKGRAKKLLN